jgi:hypothetical protein
LIMNNSKKVKFKFISRKELDKLMVNIWFFEKKWFIIFNNID